MLLLLSLCVATLVHMTSSSQWTLVCVQQDGGAENSTEQMFRRLMSASSQLQTAVAQLQTAVSQLQQDRAQLMRALLPNVDDASQTEDETESQSQSTDAPEQKTTSQPEVVKECPSGFTYVASVKGCYRLLTDPLNWTSAALECRSQHQDAHLLVVSGAQEQAAVAEMLSSTNETTLGGCSDAYWTAGQRIDPTTNSTFVWRTAPLDADVEDRATEMSYTNWADGQPNYLNEHESCVDMLADRSYSWADVRCNGKLCSVCELDITKA